MAVDSQGNGQIRVERRKPLPAELSLTFGEFLYNLRAALDNCLYAVAIIDSGQSPPPNATLLEWPITLTPVNWRNNARRLAGLAPEIRQALEHIQPYNAEAPDWNCLRILHDLARLDRHRALHLTTHYAAWGSARVDLAYVADFQGRVGPLRGDGVIATFRALTDEPLSREQLDLNLVLEVDVEGAEAVPHPITGVLQRPWGALDQRMRALLRAVGEYTHGLVEIARDVRGSRPG
ncbi:hypothetical protein E4P39_01815 [Blastococcus sp. CT_GayMR19]|uniref:hypothetical protein n=1 Tax=Blastococcus sp. CT_GayMR19 TaxID=2559608 RepID=UPI001074230F|nr:hypothetical protein [Blastococcus sp. CT_GayMR19]TFV79400.1 hypothetical protein E4P39_01815 [Blastococcus sp. CT_GayMR19]